MARTNPALLFEEADALWQIPISITPVRPVMNRTTCAVLVRLLTWAVHTAAADKVFTVVPAGTAGFDSEKTLCNRQSDAV